MTASHWWFLATAVASFLGALVAYRIGYRDGTRATQRRYEARMRVHGERNLEIFRGINMLLADREERR